MDDQKQKVIDAIKQANNILITVRNSPSLDQLAACIGLTLVVNALDKHGTAVFSGRVPSTLDFLEPTKTLEPNTDSLRDFIISLDKAKADKLRYKVEDTVVKVFITPYRTSLSASDLQFSQGDFNVDVVVALGVHNQNDLDEAITAHGRILHDATVISINTETGGAEDLGGVNWINTDASSLSEIIFSFADQLGKADVVDNQIATALLTGIVAETNRFSNNKTRPQTMETAAKLLAAGANQELVAAKLSEPERSEELPRLESAQPSDDTPVSEPKDGGKGGELDIEHLPSDEVLAPSLPMPTQDLIDQFARKDEDEPFFANEPLVEDNRLEAQDDQAADAATFDTPEYQQNNIPTIEEEVPGRENDEQDALDFLKEHKVSDNVHSRLKPVHSAVDLMRSEDAPKIVPDKHHDEAQVPGAGIDDAINTRFARTPPSMGGTLTANMPDDNEDGSLASILNDNKSGPMLSHAAPGASHSEEPEPETPIEQPQEPETIKLPQLVMPDTPPQPEISRDLPKLDAAPLIEPVEDNSEEKSPEPEEPSQPQFATLEDLEKQVHAHEEASKSAVDMPAPTGVKLPAPQESSPTGSPTGPLSPPPPVPPPMPNL